MKKMICEICGSNKIQKENGVFCCLECGTLYTVEEAKNLLKDISIDNNLQEFNANTNTSNETHLNKYEILNKLTKWFDYIQTIEEAKIPLFDFKNVWDCPEVIYIDDDKKSDCPYFVEWVKNVISKGSEYFQLGCPSWQYLYKLLIKNEGDKLDLIRSIYNKSIDFILAKKHEGFEYNYAFSDQKSEDFLNRSNYERYTFYNSCKIVFAIENFDFKSFMKALLGTSKIEITHTKSGFFKVKNYSVDFPDVNSARKPLRDFLRSAGDLYNNFMKNVVPQVIENRKDCLLEILSKQNIFVEMLDLPKKYRNLNSIYDMCEIIRNGRADSWKELLNTYESDDFKNRTLHKLDEIQLELNNMKTEISNQLDVLNNNVSEAISNISQIEFCMSKISLKVSDSNQKLNNILTCSFIGLLD